MLSRALKEIEMVRIIIVLVAVSLAAACQDTVLQASGGSQKMQLEHTRQSHASICMSS